MTGPRPAAALSSSPDPQKDRPAANTPTRTGRLLRLVRTLIDYGKELADTLRQRTATTKIATVTRDFGTADIPRILALIARALLRATALEARLIPRVAREEIAAASNAPSQQPPRAARAAEQRAGGVRIRVARLPGPDIIAAEVRHRPIAAVLADICRDLGIVPSHRLWQELSDAIVEYGGDFADLFEETFDRIFTGLPR